MADSFQTIGHPPTPLKVGQETTKLLQTFIFAKVLSPLRGVGG